MNDAIFELYFSAQKTALPENLLSGGSDFYELALHNKVESYLYLQLKNNPEISEDLLASLKKAYEKTRSANLARLEVGLVLLQELRALGLDVLILKGNAIAEDIFGDLGYKPMNDIDILVRREDLATIHQVFQKHRLHSAAAMSEDIRKQENYSHHWPPFFTQDLSCFIGTHWALAAPGRNFEIPTEDLWRDKEEFSLLGHRFHRLSPKHFLLHLCVHLSPVKTGLREIGDLVHWIHYKNAELKSSDFVQYVIQTKTEREVFAALTLAHSAWPLEFMEQVLKQLAPRLSKKDLRQAYVRAYPRRKILLNRSNYISKIEKAFGLFMLTEAPLEKTLLLAKMWRLFLLVPRVEAYRLSYVLPEAGLVTKLRAVLAAPFKISQVFIKDMGFTVFVVVTLRHQWVLLACYGSYLKKKISGKPIRNLQNIADRLGLDLNKMREVATLD
jgi:hypothetical protein